MTNPPVGAPAGGLAQVSRSVPVEGDDIFPILHRRLFTKIGTERERQEIADSFAE